MSDAERRKGGAARRYGSVGSSVATAVPEKATAASPSAADGERIAAMLPPTELSPM